ncbi:hypothetical protein CJ030_MR6G018868 [Morella rubra]|uniref:Uncharacterized protein n=1 Tax=Morella rubra TaxID=262757 RepID=A0A6A1V9Y0_9ROSI|nr:hypothetical protein CJ030_MR6G018868 [Morella rubra]
MSSSRSSRQTPFFVSSRARKKGRSIEEPTPTPEAYIYRSGLCKNRFVQDFQNRKSEDATSYVNGKQLDLSITSLNSLVPALNSGKKFSDVYGWLGISEVEPIDILRVVLDNPTLPNQFIEDYIIWSAATEKKNPRLPYGMFFTHMFHALEVDLTGEVREKPKDSKEYNKKTLRLMGFIQNEDKNGSPEPRLNVLEASMDEIKEEQKRLGKTMEDMVTSMKTGFDNIKHLLTAYTEHFGTLDKDMRALKHQVNNSIHVASNVIQDTVNEFKATSAELQTFVQKSAEDVVLAIEVQMDSDRNLHSHVLKWTYWFSTTWMEWLKKFEIEYPPPPIKKSKHSSSSSQPPPT